MRLAWTAHFVLVVALAQPAYAQTEGGTGTSTAGAEAGSTSDAIGHFRAAKKFYQEGKFIEALIEFKKAYELQPTAAISYNIARCYEQLSQWPEAIATYEQFVKETDDARDKADALDKIEFLRSKLAPDASSPEVRYRARIDTGKKAYTRGEYERAIEEFKAAFDIKPNAGVLFNIAKAYERMARYEEAIDFYTQYLDLDPNAPDRADVEETIRAHNKKIRERFQELSVSSNPPGADIYLDDRNAGLQGQTNFRFKVKPGPHTIFLDLNGYKAVKRDFVMPDNAPLALEFALEKLKNVGYATINVNVDGARIFVDGAIIGLSPYKQKKALAAGEHQITVEARGFPRYSSTFNLVRDESKAVEVILQAYEAPVADDTLSKWGRNLLLIGVIGGGLGFVGPIAYQELFLRRDVYEALGPQRVVFGDGVDADDASYWRGAKGRDGMPLADGVFTEDYKENGQANTLKWVQYGALIGGGVFVAAGLTFYIYMWARPETNVDVVTSSLDEAERAPIQITSWGVAPNPDGGASFGLTGSF